MKEPEEILLKELTDLELKNLADYLFCSSRKRFAFSSVLSTFDKCHLLPLCHWIEQRILCHQIIMRNVLRERVFPFFFIDDPDPTNIVRKFLEHSKELHPMWMIFKAVAFLIEHYMYKKYNSAVPCLYMYYAAFAKVYEEVIKPKPLLTELTWENLLTEANTEDTIKCWSLLISANREGETTFYHKVNTNIDLNEIQDPDPLLCDPIENIKAAFLS